MAKEYLGDSVYANVTPDGKYIVLTTENGCPDRPSNTIYLEALVLNALGAFIINLPQKR